MKCKLTITKTTIDIFFVAIFMIIFFVGIIVAYCGNRQKNNKIRNIGLVIIIFNFFCGPCIKVLLHLSHKPKYTPIP